MKFLLWPLIFVGVLFAFSIIRNSQEFERVDVPKYDERCREELGKKGNTEASSWLENEPLGTRRLGGEDHYDHQEARVFIKEFYACGAVKATVITPATWKDPVNGLTVQGSDTLIVELPDNPEKRRCIFELERKNRREKSQEFSCVGEQGQKYLFFWWD